MNRLGFWNCAESLERAPESGSESSSEILSFLEGA